jgi:hypothetical protein
VPIGNPFAFVLLRRPWLQRSLATLSQAILTMVAVLSLALSCSACGRRAAARLRRRERDARGLYVPAPHSALAELLRALMCLVRGSSLSRSSREHAATVETAMVTNCYCYCYCYCEAHSMSSHVKSACRLFAPCRAHSRTGERLRCWCSAGKTGTWVRLENAPCQS